MANFAKKNVPANNAAKAKMEKSEIKVVNIKIPSFYLK